MNLPDSLGNNAFCVLYICQSQLGGDISQGDAAVGQADSAQPCPDHVVAQPDDEVRGTVLGKHLLI